LFGFQRQIIVSIPEGPIKSHIILILKAKRIQFQFPKDQLKVWPFVFLAFLLVVFQFPKDQLKAEVTIDTPPPPDRFNSRRTN